MHQELVEYNEFKEELKGDLEGYYSAAIIRGDYRSAYNMLQKMMEMNMIDGNDPRLNNKKMLSELGLKSDHRFAFDVRNGNFIPTWLYHSITRVKVLSCPNMRHAGKRVEGNYEGDIIYESINKNIRIEECRRPKALDDILDYIENMARKCNGQFNRAEMHELLINGVYRVFTVTCENSMPNYKLLGYIIVSLDGEGRLKGVMFPKFESFLHHWLHIDRTLNSIFSYLYNDICAGSIRLYVKKDKAVERQNSMIKATEDMIKSMTVSNKRG